MSAPLWKSFFSNDVDQFRHLLANATFVSSAPHSKGGAAGFPTPNGASAASLSTSLGTSPTLSHKGKRGPSGALHAPSSARGIKSSASLVLTRTDVNIRDAGGRTLLHHLASSTNDEAIQFVNALLEVQWVDLYAQDAENAWTALHRALYFGNVAVARALIERDIQDAVGQANAGGCYNAAGLIKIKDREGNSPFDVYGASIASRNIQHDIATPTLPENSDDDENPNAYGLSGDSGDEEPRSNIIQPKIGVNGDELFTFGSNKNFTLGFGDEDDRQFPERISLNRPDRLLHRLTEEHKALRSPSNPVLAHQVFSPAVPAVVQYKPIIFQDVRLAKFHSAVLTNDPATNLYVCGFGPGGRLGTGDEMTRFNFVPICTGGLAGRRVVDVGLGQNHTVAVTSTGEVFSWGNNVFGQLGYGLPPSNNRDEEPIQLTPKQVFGPLKRELVQGTAASRVHTVVYTAASLFTFGKNDGQLGLVDSDARSLTIQFTPRRVAASLFSSPIHTVSAIDKATICLLDNHDVWIFANYGYTKLLVPLDGSKDILKNHFLGMRYNSVPTHICKITSGGDTVCVMSNEGDVFTVNINQKAEAMTSNGSTTNPAKIRGALSVPQRIWTRKKGHMAVRDVDVGQDGSVIICTEAGSVWRRMKRAKVKDANAPLLAGYKPKDYKFSRIPGLTRIIAVRSNIFGAYAAVRGDSDILKSQITVGPRTLWSDLYPLLSFRDMAAKEEDSETENPRLRFWTPTIPSSSTSSILQAVLYAPNVEQSVADQLAENRRTGYLNCDMHVGTTMSKVHFPVHECILAARSSTLSRALSTFRNDYFFSIPQTLTIEYDKDGNILLLFIGMDFLTVLDFVLYTYTDAVADVWLQTRQPARVISRYRLIRSELMHIAAQLNMLKLEQAVRAQTQPAKTLHEDLDRVICESKFFENGDVEILLNGAELKAHSSILCQRCPFFEGLFQGRAAGQWISARRQQSQEVVQVDLKHIDPKTFMFVRRHIYTDAGEELFDDVNCPDVESFLDLILEVMSVANELMLDRLSQCCQKVLGGYVEVRNVCPLLNAVAPCSVTEFKRAALEYICLNLEGMLETQLLNELDQDLLLELDIMVRQNQLARLPVSRSGRAELELLDSYPQLAEIIERGKRTKVDQIAFQSRWRHDDFLAKSLITRTSKSIEDGDRDQPPTRLKHISAIDPGRTPEENPSLKTRRSTGDLIFEMDDNEGNHPEIPAHQRSSNHMEDSSAIGNTNQASLSVAESPWLAAKNENPHIDIASSTSPFNLGEGSQQPAVHDIDLPTSPRNSPMSKPWGNHAIGSQKLDMKSIFNQASSNQVSSLSTGFSSLRANSNPVGKLSQKERKKQQQQQAALQQSRDVPAPQPAEPQTEAVKSVTPWRVASSGAKASSLKEIIGAQSDSPSLARNKSDKFTSNPPLTLRQTIPGNIPATKSTITADSSIRQQIPTQRSTSTPTIIQAINTPPRPSTSGSIPSPSPIAIGPSNTPTRSIRHVSTPSLGAEPSLQLSMADILSQQQTEKDVFKEAVAKRSLQEIQEEQAFQEWWDQE
ncbi:MAG: hypothetical protein Q9224_003422, partial [Gallowayella concinna]